MIDNRLGQRGVPLAVPVHWKPIRRRGALPLPMTIALVLGVVVLAVLLFNWFFYGRSVEILEQRVVLADIEDFPQFVRECSDDPASVDQIVTMRDDPGGNYLLLRTQVLVKHIYDKIGTHTGQIILRGDNFALESGNQKWNAVLLSRGAPDGDQLVIRSLALKRRSDGSIEHVDSGAKTQDEDPTLGDLVRGVKQLHGAASFGSGGRRGVLDWVRAPLNERSKIIQPPALTNYVWRAEITRNEQDAWRAAEVVCLFPIPPRGSTAKLVVFEDKQTAIPVTVQ